MEFLARRKKYLVGVRYAALEHLENIALLLQGFYFVALPRSGDRGAHWHKNTGSVKYSLMTKTFLNAVSAAKSSGMGSERLFPLLLICRFVTTATLRFALAIHPRTG